MVIDKIVKDKPIQDHGEFTLGSGSTNATHLWLWVAGCTDLAIRIHNTHASEGITISIDWCMAADAEDLLTDAIGSDPTLAANISGIYRFSSEYPLYTTDFIVAPHYVSVLPCGWIRIEMYGTSAASSCKVWVQGHKRRF